MNFGDIQKIEEDERVDHEKIDDVHQPTQVINLEALSVSERHVLMSLCENLSNAIKEVVVDDEPYFEFPEVETAMEDLKRFLKPIATQGIAKSIFDQLTCPEDTEPFAFTSYLDNFIQRSKVFLITYKNCRESINNIVLENNLRIDGISLFFDNMARYFTQIRNNLQIYLIDTELDSQRYNSARQKLHRTLVNYWLDFMELDKKSGMESDDLLKVVSESGILMLRNLMRKLNIELPPEADDQVYILTLEQELTEICIALLRLETDYRSHQIQLEARSGCSVIDDSNEYVTFPPTVNGPEN